MAKRVDKNAARVRQLFNSCNQNTRSQWEYVNQKGFDFANDNQLTEAERIALEEQGMPTFTINRILPVVEMLNFYATANNPRWQAVGVEGSDSDVGAVFSDIADYIWAGSDGSSVYSNAINDAITKSVGYLLVSVDPDSDNGMGDVKILQPEPFDVYVDPKSRHMLFKDAAFIMIRKVLPKTHLMKMYPDSIAKIRNAASDQNSEFSYTEKATGGFQKDFTYNDIHESESIDPSSGEQDMLMELFEVYEKIKVAYINMNYRMPPSAEEMQAIQEQVTVQIEDMKAEMGVELLELDKKMKAAVQSGEMLPERYQLEMKKAQEEMQAQLQGAQQEMQREMQAAATRIENKIISEAEFKLLMKDKTFASMIVDSVKFYGTRVQQTCVIGDSTVYKNVLPEKITEYPIVPFHFKWTGTPYPISAVSPLIGKQREMNKAHQLMLHNASLGSSLRWMHEEGSIDTDYWEQYSSAPGALLPIRPGATPPTPVMPAPLSNAFFGIVNEGKQDMEYLAGIYGAMQGDTSAQHETYKGMLAMDEYGTRRVKQWMKNAIEPGLRQLGTIVGQFSQTVYSGHRTFRIIQPNNINEEKMAEINVPLYNDLGEAIGKFNDYSTMKFDVRIVAGSTLPVNRWAYLDELKSYMEMGVIDDIAFLAETDVKNKESIVKRKSLYAQLKGQISQLEESAKNSAGTIETLERQIVQSGIRDKVMKASMEVDKKANQVKSRQEKEALETQAQHKVLRETQKAFAGAEKGKFSASLKNIIKGLESSKED